MVIFLGLVWSEIKQLWDVGLQEYVGDMWNVIDFVTNALYVATVALRIVAFYQVCLCYTINSSPKSCSFLLLLMLLYSPVFTFLGEKVGKFIYMLLSQFDH